MTRRAARAPALFDSHCHLGFGDEDPAELWRRARAAGVVAALDVGIDAATSAAARDRAAALPGVCWSAGLHPNSAADLDTEWAEIEALSASGCAAVGETGLDFYWDRAPRAQQVATFERHLDLAIRLDKPVVVHCRDAFPATLEILAAHPAARGVMHCFAGGVDEARRVVDLGFHLSFAGPLTYPRNGALREAAAFAPLDRVLVETDAPFLAPHGHRGRRNEPALIAVTLAALADARGIDDVAAAAATTANAMRLFGTAGAD